MSRSLSIKPVFLSIKLKTHNPKQVSGAMWFLSKRKNVESINSEIHEKLLSEWESIYDQIPGTTHKLLGITNIESEICVCNNLLFNYQKRIIFKIRYQKKENSVAV